MIAMMMNTIHFGSWLKANITPLAVTVPASKINISSFPFF
jgi:hypothetical protein